MLHGFHHRRHSDSTQSVAVGGLGFGVWGLGCRGYHVGLVGEATDGSFDLVEPRVVLCRVCVQRVRGVWRWCLRFRGLGHDLVGPSTLLSFQ